MLTKILVTTTHDKYPIADTAEALRRLADQLEKYDEDEGEKPNEIDVVQSTTFFVSAVTEEND